MYFYGGFFFTLIGVGVTHFFRHDLTHNIQWVLTHASTDFYMHLVTIHGILMIFFLIMPVLWATFGNLAVPLYIGLSEVSFPKLNNASILIWIASATAFVITTVEGGTGYGWTLYPTLATTMMMLTFFGIVSLSIVLLVNGLSSTLTSTNFIATWLLSINTYDNSIAGYIISNVITSILLVLVLPVLTAALVHLYADVVWNTTHYAAEENGEPVAYQHIFWVFGHPEVYILAIPGFALITVNGDNVLTSQTFGMIGMLNGLLAIAILGFIVWAHHMYTTGNESDSVVYFGIATMAIAIPSGIKILHWLNEPV
jgi:cytochrome c oxidase subunit 1